MDVFFQRNFTNRLIQFLIALNLLLIGFMIWKGIISSEPLLYPKNEAYRDVTGILQKELQLDSDQLKKFDEIREKYFVKQVEIKGLIKKDKDAMNSEMFQKFTNESRVILLAKSIANNELKIELLRYQQAREFKQVCTPKQLMKFELLVKEIRDYSRPDNQLIRR